METKEDLRKLRKELRLKRKTANYLYRNGGSSNDPVIMGMMDDNDERIKRD